MKVKKKLKTNSTLRRCNVALSVKKNLSTSSQKNYNSAATIYKVDLGSKCLVAFGPSIPHKSTERFNLGGSHIAESDIVINAQFCEKCLALI